MIIDSHVHVGRWMIPDFRGHATTLEQTADALLAAGIEGALVMPTDDGDNVGLLSAIGAYQGALEIAMAVWAFPVTDNPGKACNVGFALESGKIGPGGSSIVRAVKIHPSFSRVPITDAAWVPALGMARDHSLPVVVHCGRWQEMAGYGLLLKAAAVWPDIDFVMAHMGGDSPALVQAAADKVVGLGLRNVYLGTESIREYWMVERAINTVGADRVLFGSDHNLNPPAAFLAVIDAISLEPHDRALVKGLNAARLFGFDSDGPASGGIRDKSAGIA